MRERNTDNEAYKIKLAKSKKWNKEHSKELCAYSSKYRSKKKGRASILYNAYRNADALYKREYTAPPITSSYILDRIFTSSCYYCGETNWRKLGCDRIDNNLPHQEGNVICCCKKCNIKKGLKSVKLYKDTVEFERSQPTLFDFLD